MGSHIGRIAVKTGLPSRGNTGDPAERDKEQGLDAAVSPKVLRAVFRNAGHQRIVPHVGILDVFRNVIVDPPGDLHGTLLLADNLRRQRPKIRSKTDVGVLFSQAGNEVSDVLHPYMVKILCSRNFSMPEIEIFCPHNILILHKESPVLLKRILKADGPPHGSWFVHGHFSLRVI